MFLFGSSILVNLVWLSFLILFFKLLTETIKGLKYSSLYEMWIISER